MVEQRLAGPTGRALLNKAFDIEKRCEEIKKLNKNVKELYKLMEDINLIVKLQGEKIDSIANQVRSAKHYTAQGVNVIEGLVKDQKSNRRVRNS